MGDLFGKADVSNIGSTDIITQHRSRYTCPHAETDRQTVQLCQSRGRGRGAISPLFPTPKKVRGGQILNIVIVVRLEIKNLEESDFLSIKIMIFSYFLPLVRKTKSLTF